MLNRFLAVAIVFAGTLPAAASDGAVPMLERGIRLDVPFNDVGSLSFEHPAYQGAQAIVRLENGSVLAGTDSDALTLQDGISEDDLLHGEMSVLLMDIDFDGYLDVGVVDGVGYGGVNWFWQFYRADPDGLFVPVQGTVSNPERDDVVGAIVSNSRSGPFWSRDVHRYENGNLQLVVSRERHGDYDVVSFPSAYKGGESQRGIIPTIAPDPWEPEVLEDPAFHQFAISTNPGRAYFHDEPDPATRRAAYLVEGDVGRVTDVAAWGAWFFMVFTHPETRITTTGWMRAEDLVLPQG